MIDSSGDHPATTAAQSLCAQDVQGLQALHAWEDDYGSGLELVTAHYRVFTTYSDSIFLKRLPAFLESAHAAYNQVLPEPVVPQARSIVYLFSNRVQWEAFTGAFTGSKATALCQIRQGAYCHKGACVAYHIGVDRTLAALSHEGWHQFMTRHFAYRLPSWLDEGMAMLFECFAWEEPHQIHFQCRSNSFRVMHLRQLVEQGTLLPLERLLVTSPGEMMALDNSQAVLGFYSQSYALVRFLWDGQGGVYRSGFQQLLNDGLAAGWPLDVSMRKTAADRNCPRTLDWNRKVSTQLFHHYISSDLQALNGQYYDFCRKMVQLKSAQECP